MNGMGSQRGRGPTPRVRWQGTGYATLGTADAPPITREAIERAGRAEADYCAALVNQARAMERNPLADPATVREEALRVHAILLQRRRALTEDLAEIAARYGIDLVIQHGRRSEEMPTYLDVAAGLIDLELVAINGLISRIDHGGVDA